MADTLDSVKLLQALDTKIDILDMQSDNLLAIARSIGLVEAKILVHAHNQDALEASKCFDEVRTRIDKYQSILRGE